MKKCPFCAALLVALAIGCISRLEQPATQNDATSEESDGVKFINRYPVVIDQIEHEFRGWCFGEPGSFGLGSGWCDDGEEPDDMRDSFVVFVSNESDEQVKSRVAIRRRDDGGYWLDGTALSHVVDSGWDVNIPPRDKQRFEYMHAGLADELRRRLGRRRGTWKS